jgi:hypothetical protein
LRSAWQESSSSPQTVIKNGVLFSGISDPLRYKIPVSPAPAVYFQSHTKDGGKSLMVNNLFLSKRYPA